MLSFLWRKRLARVKEPAVVNHPSNVRSSEIKSSSNFVDDSPRVRRRIVNSLGSLFFFSFLFFHEKEPSSFLSRCMHVARVFLSRTCNRNKQLFSESVPRTINRPASFQIKQTLEQNLHLVRWLILFVRFHFSSFFKHHVQLILARFLFPPSPI